MADDDNPWGFIPDNWPKIESREEYLAYRPMLTGFEQGIAMCPPGELRSKFIVNSDGMRFRMREWELDHGITPGSDPPS